jgi:hypothetical protein
MKADATKLQDKSANRGITDAYNLLVIEVKQLRSARSALDSKIEKAEAARDLLEQLVAAPNTLSSSEVGYFSPEKTPRRRGPQKDSKTAAVLNRARQVLLAAGRPLPRAELLAAMNSEGFEIKTKDPARFIGRALWRSSDFVHIRKEGYWIRSDNTSPGKSE